MASINARSGELFFDFRYQGVRCREYTKLADTPANRKRMQKALGKIEHAIATGTFRYADFFPGSKLTAKFGGNSSALARYPDSEGASAQIDTPLFRTFIDEWFAASLPAWSILLQLDEGYGNGCWRQAVAIARCPNRLSE